MADKLIIPNECGEYPFSFYGNYNAAQICKTKLEEKNPNKVFHLEIDYNINLCEEGGCPDNTYYIEEGLPRGCSETDGGSFDHLSSRTNKEAATSCMEALNRLEKIKGTDKTWQAIKTKTKWFGQTHVWETKAKE